MRVLIIGAKGMLGQELVKTFQEGNEVFAWDRDEVNLAKIIDCRSSIIDLKPDIIINSAAYTNVDKAESEPDKANAVNGNAVGDLAAICRELDVPIMHFSTEYVFDGQKKDGYAETDKPNPISAYGASKYLGETELQKNTDKFYLIRLSRLFGKDSPPPLSLPLKGEEGGGEFPSPQGGGSGRGDRGRKNSFVRLMLELAKTKKELEVVDEELSCPTYAPDLAKLTRYIIENKLPYGIYHGAGSGSTTWFGFAKEIFKIAEINVKLIPVPSSRFPRPAKRPAYGILLNTKLPEQRAWQEALKESMNFTNN